MLARYAAALLIAVAASPLTASFCMSHPSEISGVRSSAMAAVIAPELERDAGVARFPTETVWMPVRLVTRAELEAFDHAVLPVCVAVHSHACRHIRLAAAPRAAPSSIASFALRI